MKRKILYPIIAILFTFTISCEKEVYTGVEPEVKIDKSVIVIESQPPDFQIYLNGRNMGVKTPDSLTNLAAGTHKITLKRNLLKDSVFTITIADDERIKLSIDYFKNPGNYGKINCYSSPSNAELFLDNVKQQQKTPLLLTGMFPGTYKIMMRYPQHRDDSIFVPVRGGELASAFIALDDTSKWVIYNAKNSKLVTDFFSTIAVDNNGIKWIGTTENGIVRSDGKSFELINTNNSGLINNVINALAVDSQNKLWIGTSNGLMVYDGSIWINYNSDIPSTGVTAIHKDIKNNMWIGTLGGLVKFDGTSWKTFTTSNSGLASNIVTCLESDQNGKIWIGSSFAGISSFDGTQWKAYNMNNMGLNINVGNGIKSLMVDKDGKVWAGHVEDLKNGDVGGLTQFDGNKWSVVNLRGYLTNQINSMKVDKNNIKWICGKNGIALFDQLNNIVVMNNIYTRLPVNYVTSVTIDLSDNLWITTFGGGFVKVKKGNYGLN
ncbi:MAG: PEGA domain-containing protein [Melioribacteraceae bacterium]|nr:PEGA domain-containing protein [Melioribacteraceae bacterium]